MNGYLYKSYCYKTIEQVAASVHSSFLLDGFGVIQSVLPSGSNLLIDYIDSNSQMQMLSYSVASCPKLGFDNSFTGLTDLDSIAIGSAVSGVLIAAWSIKILKRVF